MLFRSSLSLSRIEEFEQPRSIMSSTTVRTYFRRCAPLVAERVMLIDVTFRGLCGVAELHNAENDARLKRTALFHGSLRARMRAPIGRGDFSYLATSLVNFLLASRE